VNKLVITLAIVTGVGAAAIFALWLLVDVNQFRPFLERSLTDALGRTVTVGNITVSLRSGGISLDGLTIADDPAFSGEPFVTASAVTAGIDVRPLILTRSLHVRSFRLERPRVALRRSALGAWNVSSLGATPSSSGGTSVAALSLLVQRLEIVEGQLVLSTSRGPDRVYDDVNVELSEVSYAAPFSFRATAALPGGGGARLRGTAGPVDVDDLTSTPFGADVQLQRLDVASTGFVDAGSGLRGLVDLAGTLASDGVAVTTKGELTARNLQFVPDGSPASVAAVVDFDSTFNARTQRGVVRRGDVRIGRAVARLTGDYNTKAATPRVRLRLVGDKMPIADLEGALPALGTTLPAGASLRNGTMDATLGIEGPLDRLIVTGPMVIANGTLAGFDLGGKLGAIAAFAGLPKGSDTVLETLGAHLRVAPEGIAVDGISMVVPAIGTLTGAGSVAPDDALDFRMTAKLNTGPAVPFRIVGTSSNPTFRPDLGAIGKSVTAHITGAARDPSLQKKAVQAIGDFFRRRTQKEP
jgi:AsmA protein